MLSRFHCKQILFASYVVLFLIFLSSLLSSCKKGAAATQQATQQAPQPVTKQIGLRGWETKEVVVSQFQDLDFQSRGCATRPDSVEYSDCKFTRDDEEVSVSFVGGRLQRLDYSFGAWRFPRVLAKVKSVFGEPTRSPADPKCEGQCLFDYAWCKGHGCIETDISLGTTADNKNGWAQFTLDPQKDMLHLLPIVFPFPAVATAPERSEAAQKFDEQKRNDAACPATAEDCITVTILKSGHETITKRDANGYAHDISPALQRLAVSLRGKRENDGLYVNGENFKYADILCLKDCNELEIGDMYRMRFGRLQTHMRACYAEYGDCWKYDNLPYVAIDNPKGTVSAWQILEVCTADQKCVAMSTVNSR